MDSCKLRFFSVLALSSFFGDTAVGPTELDPPDESVELGLSVATGEVDFPVGSESPVGSAVVESGSTDVLSGTSVGTDDGGVTDCVIGATVVTSPLATKR